MPNYRRFQRPGGTFFFTVNLADRTSSLLVDRIQDFRDAYATVARHHPFLTEAIVVMPDHLHAVWTLPDGDTDFSVRWKKIKAGFSKVVIRDANGGLAPTLRVSASMRAKGEVGVWQRRFWEHAIRDEADLASHIEYCWHNPVKHGFVTDPMEWPFSSIHRDMPVVGRASRRVGANPPRGGSA
ncbi:transposase [Maritimibacter sp. UBA3975]|uniref:REP-associated tyrosine transposase n=1 Tax=Maritimibacter sp. UBA3975 TaxID=1946833 RepID=UPI000C0AFDA7|nr:transposase [Maritimibacter sp. UBA3975]MAM60899.1 transposase [Maritimibacter sp.]|tara:strand:+ start:16494 stop:17042 length:549 start_codon:yes stop_codon:yes gene_type:complete